MTTRALDRYSCVCAVLSNRSWRNSSLLIAALIVVLGAFLSGCAGVTSAKGSSATATNSDTTTSGTSGASGSLSVSPAAVTFGNVAVGSTSNQSLSVTNSGSVALTISQVTVTGAGFTVGGASLPLTLSPGNTFTFTASFDPTTAGDVSGSFSIVSPQLSSPLAMSMSGTGTGSRSRDHQPAFEPVRADWPNSDIFSNRFRHGALELSVAQEWRRP